MARLTPQLALQLAAPHTWVASIFPVLMAVAFAAVRTQAISVPFTLILLVIAVLMQSAVNTFNDYFDYVKGSDTTDDAVEEHDAVLVYNDLAPKQALNLAIVFLLAAFSLGILCIVRAGWIPLTIALIGAAATLLYSGGKTPLSYLPIGEVVSGFVMGGLLTLASYQVLTLQLDWIVLVWSIPLMIGIALIMMTNNTCDIEKDTDARRHTLPVCLGRKRAQILYRALLIIWMSSLCIIVALWFTKGIVLLPFMILAAHGCVRALFGCSLTPSVRIAAMGQICSANILFGAFYAASVFASGCLQLYC